MKTVLVLGSTGMLGEKVFNTLLKNREPKVIGTNRISHHPTNILFDAIDLDFSSLLQDLIAQKLNPDYIINCIGITKPYCKDDNMEQCYTAMKVNSIFPHHLAMQFPESRIIQIATDCVYTGTIGRYTEDALHDATDVYGKTKSLGEVLAPNMIHLRDSIIGPEPKKAFLLEWFLGQTQGASLNGFTNHHWNGITTYHFAKICEGIIMNDFWDFPSRKVHVIPEDIVTKYELLNIFAGAFKRHDITINATEAGVAVDRSLGTNYPELNKKLWQMAGYATVPTMREMINEIA